MTVQLVSSNEAPPGVLRVVYCRSHVLGSPIIRRFTWSSWSHEALLTPDNTVIEARFTEGVIERPLNDLLETSSAWEVRRWTVPDVSAGVAWAREQIGKGYDYMGAIGIGLHKDLEDPTRLLCSEVVEGAFQAAGRPRFVNQVRRITPQISYMVA